MNILKTQITVINQELRLKNLAKFRVFQQFCRPLTT